MSYREGNTGVKRKQTKNLESFFCFVFIFLSQVKLLFSIWSNELGNLIQFLRVFLIFLLLICCCSASFRYPFTLLPFSLQLICSLPLFFTDSNFYVNVLSMWNKSVTLSPSWVWQEWFNSSRSWKDCSANLRQALALIAMNKTEAIWLQHFKWDEVWLTPLLYLLKNRF